MATVCPTTVYHYALQLILGIPVGDLGLCLLCQIPLHIDFERVLKLVIQFFSFPSLIVELEPIQTEG